MKKQNRVNIPKAKPSTEKQKAWLGKVAKASVESLKKIKK